MTVIKSIFADSKAILPCVIMSSRNIIVSWFNKNITKAKVVTVSPLGYTNKRILYIIVGTREQEPDRA
jgi:hypothetical protein